ncbi:MAG: hypothetical protein P8X67_19635, partial [Syntrophobacterales bacterium]
MKKKIVPTLLALVLLFVMLMVIDSGFREKVGVIIGHVSWLDSAVSATAAALPALTQSSIRSRAFVPALSNAA